MAIPGRANTPNWDLISTCRSNDRAGLVLVEAKSHEGELANDQCAATSPENLQRIEMALGEATVACNALTPGFALSANSHYQLSNRVAFAWKLAKMGIPVVLVYLGFIDAHEMRDDYKLLKDHAQWRYRVLAASEGTVPAKAWGSTLDVDGTPLTMLIGSAVVGIHAQSAVDETSV